MKYGYTKPGLVSRIIHVLNTCGTLIWHYPLYGQRKCLCMIHGQPVTSVLDSQSIQIARRRGQFTILFHISRYSILNLLDMCLVDI